MASWVNWALNVFPLLCPCLNTFYAKMAGSYNPTQRIWVNNSVHKDLLWVARHIEMSSRVHILQVSSWDPDTADLVAYCDACLDGMDFCTLPLPLPSKPQCWKIHQYLWFFILKPCVFFVCFLRILLLGCKTVLVWLFSLTIWILCRGSTHWLACLTTINCFITPWIFYWLTTSIYMCFMSQENRTWSQMPCHKRSLLSLCIPHGIHVIPDGFHLFHMEYVLGGIPAILVIPSHLESTWIPSKFHME